MNIKQAKERFTLQSLLALLGHQPDKKKSKAHDLWYNSPLRPGEKDPSFHIDSRNDIYKDFGDTEKGGDLIWFAQQYLKSQGKEYSVSSALKWFEELDGGTQVHTFNKKAYKKVLETSKEAQPYKILSDKDIFSKALLDYLDKKGLPLPLSKKYLRQIYFQNNKTNKKMFGLGFKTRAGGYDIRLANGFKTMIGNKDITIIEGFRKALTINIFEGVSDFLTMLAIQQKDMPEYDTIILNSGNLYEQATIYIQEKGYAHIKTWFDNDTAGKKFEDALLNKLDNNSSNYEISRMNHVYEGFKDLNAWHTGSGLSLSSKKNVLLDFPQSKAFKAALNGLRA